MLHNIKQFFLPTRKTLALTFGAVKLHDRSRFLIQIL